MPIITEADGSAWILGYPVLNPHLEACTDLDEDCPSMTRAEVVRCAHWHPEHGYCPFMD